MSWKKIFCGLVVFLFVAMIVSPALAETHYEVIDLNAQVNGIIGEARDINNSGMIVGKCYITIPGGSQQTRAVMWHNGTGWDMSSFAGAGNFSSEAFGVNSSGIGVGRASNTFRNRAFYETYHGVITQMPDLGYQATAYSINDGNVSVGNSGISNNVPYAVRWAGLGAPAFNMGWGDWSTAYDVNNSNLNVGSSKIFVLNTGRACYSIGTGAVVQLPQQATVIDSVAHANNNAGDIVGVGRATSTPNSQSHALWWQSIGSAPIDLGTLGAGTTSEAHDINISDQIVGYGHTGTMHHGFLYENSTLYDLNDLIWASQTSEWTVTKALGINDNGDIVGVAWDALGGSHAILLTMTSVDPNYVPLPGVAWLLTMGLGGLFLVRKKALK